MTSLWESAELGTVPVPARMVAGAVAAGLGHPGSSVIEVARLHLEALDAALALEVPELLGDQLHWQQIRLRSLGTPVSRDAFEAAVLDQLAPHLERDAIGAVERVQDAARDVAATLQEEMPLTRLVEGPAHDYLMAALSGRRDDALDVIRQAMRDEAEVAEIMLDILEPAQVELGLLWEEGEISIAHEHYTTAITQLSLSLLYPRLLLDRTLLGHSMVGVAIGLEAHEIGIRMVSDLLEQAGWRSAYLGADVPDSDIVDQVAQQRADVLAVSATMAGHVAGVRRLVAEVRADPRCDGVRVLVGGRPFARVPGLASRVGADGTAPGALEAVAVCREWAGDRISAP